MYEYNVKSIAKIVDGDTVDVVLDLGFSILHKIRVRLHGINAPESRTRDLLEKRAGLAAKQRLTELISEAPSLILATKEKGKYGRYLGIFYTRDNPEADVVNVNETLVTEGHAERYFGGKR